VKIQFDQIIALVIILGTLGLMFCGIDSEVKSVFLMAAGWAFGSGFQARHLAPEKKQPPANETSR